MKTYRALDAIARLLCLGLLLALACPARADVAVMVPPRSDPGTSNDLLEQAVEELVRLLRVQGFDVISAGQAGATAEAEQQRGGFSGSYDPLYCVTPECANEFRRLFDAPFAVQLGVSPSPRARTVTVTLTEGTRAFFAGTAPVEANDLRAAARAAFESAREKQKDGVGPWLTVTGSPEGASVRVDGADYGKLPLTKRRIEPGTRRIEVRADDHALESRSLDIPVRIDHVESLEVHLRSLHMPAPRAGFWGDARARRTAWDWALGGALAAAGAVHLTAGIYQKAVEGDCIERTALGCSERYGDRQGASRANLLLGFGAAGLAAGALVVAYAPIGRLQVRSGVDRASIELKGEF